MRLLFMAQLRESDEFNRRRCARGLLTKTLLVMNLTAILLLAAVLHVNASGIAQTVTYSAKAEPIAKVFSVIEEQTGYAFFYREEDLKSSKPVSVELKDADINTSLKAVLANQLLQYEIEGNTILISTKPVDIKSVLAKALEEAPPVSGVVRGPDGQPLSGVNIIVRGTKRGTTSSGDGKFSIDAKGGDVLIFTSVGYEQKEIKIGVYNEIGVVQLALSDSKLDEVQIIAYGTTTKRLNTGNVATIKADVIEKQPVNNPLLALQGRVPGMFIEQASGVPGTAVKIAIQGKNSIINGNDPFYVIDGVPYISQLMQSSPPGITAGSTGVEGNPLNFINPGEIESIEILKDADATAIYGSRAANGAILITTKKGKSGAMRTSLNIQKGWGEVSHKLKVLNTEQYLEMRHEALKNDGIANPSTVDYDLNGTWDTTQTKDWQDELLGGSAQYNDIQLGFSGGTNLTQYLISGSYHKETSVFPGNFSDTKGSAHFNFRSTSVDQKFKIELSGSYLKDNNLLPTSDLTRTALQLAPVVPNPLNPDGSLNWAPAASGESTNLNNPLTFLKRTYNNKTDNLISQAVLSYKIYPWLSIKSNFGYTNLRSNETLIEPLSAVAPEWLSFSQGTTYFGTTNMNSWVIEPAIEFNRDVFGGKLNTYLGATLQDNQGNIQRLLATGFSNDLLLGDIKAATQIDALQSAYYNYKYNALYGRINYNLKDIYILNLTARRDGSSRFGPQNQFHNFGAIGAAWIFSQMHSMQKSLSFLSFGKLRASYGITGNDQIGDYQFLDLYDIVWADLAYQQGPLGLAPTRLSTPDLQWEETRKLQIGLELGFLKDRILVTTNYNHNRSSNQLLGITLPFVTGFPGIARNLNALVQNTGWEFSFNSTNIKTKMFSWSSNINLTIPKNKFISVGNSNSVFFPVGESITSTAVSKLAGVNANTGKFEFIDDKGNLTNTPVDITKYIYRDPKFYGGFQNSLSYKNFSLDFLFQFVKRIGQDLTYGYGQGPAGRFISGINNQPITVLDRWQKVGDKATQPQFTTKGGAATLSLTYARSSDATYTDASYIRFKNLSFSWKMDEKVTKKIGLQNLRLYIQGQNLFTITNFFGMDPESGGVGLPPLRVITFGAKVIL